VATALELYTMGTASLNHEQDRLGSITPGKLADLVVAVQADRFQTEGGGSPESADRGLVSKVVIRTPDQRSRVFVSSTLEELAEERRAVSRAISALRLVPVMFELGARPHPPQELYRSYLAQSDVFIGLYWQRYGWTGPGMNVSGLEEEFNLSGEMPRLLYIKAPAPQPRAPRGRAAGADPGGGHDLLPHLRYSC
jgi:Domain of unknown function (DUF4062)